MPDVAKDIITFNTLNNLLWATVTTASVVAGVGLWLYGLHGASDSHMAAIVIGPLSAIISLLFLVGIVADGIKLRCAPKLYIMDQLAKRLATMNQN